METKNSPGAHAHAPAPAPASVPVEGARSLSEVALLVDLTVSRWNPYATDERADEAVRSAYANDRETGSYRKRLLPIAPPEWEAITSAHAAMLRIHRFYSQPWSAGVRVMPSAVWNEYGIAMRSHVRDFGDAADAFCDPATYDRIVTDALSRLGGLARREDYPAPERIRSRFHVDIATWPLPERGDFRVDVGRDAREAMAQSYERAVERAVEAATGDLWGRLREAVEGMRGSVARYHSKAGGEGRAVLKEGTFRNLRRLLDVLPRLNFTANADIASIAQEIEAAFGTLNAETLRDDEATRAEVVRQADDIAAKMAAFMGA